MKRIKQSKRELFDHMAGTLAENVGEYLSECYLDTHVVNDATFDYAYGYSPVIDVRMAEPLDCEAINDAQFDALEAFLATLTYKCEGFTIVATFEDNSGRAYWADQGDPLGIMLTAEIFDVTKCSADNMADTFIGLAKQINNFHNGDKL